MGLDAVVYCNCFELGLLREPPPPASRPSFSEDGSLVCESDDDEILAAFDEWQADRACEHGYGFLLHHRIGNIATVAWLRDELSRSDFAFPIILDAVLYSGTHCGDFIEHAILEHLRTEIDQLANVVCADPGMEPCLREFDSQMRELFEAALEIRKPIVFT